MTAWWGGFLESPGFTPPKFNIAPEKWWLEDYFPIGKVTSTKTKISPIFLPFFLGGHTFLVVFHNDKHPSCPTPPEKISTEGRACDPFDCNEDLKGWKTRTGGIFHRDQKSSRDFLFVLFGFFKEGRDDQKSGKVGDFWG